MTPKIQAALDKLGAKLKRHRKHYVFELPNGQNVVVASTPSDRRSEQAALHQIARIAEPLAKRPRAEVQVAAPLERRSKPGRREAEWSLPINSMAVAFERGNTRAHLADRISALEQEAKAERLRADGWAAEYTRVAQAYSALRSSRWVRLGVRVRVVRS